MYVGLFIGLGVGLGLAFVGKYDSAMRVSYMRLSLLLPTYLGYGLSLCDQLHMKSINTFDIDKNHFLLKILNLLLSCKILPHTRASSKKIW